MPHGHCYLWKPGLVWSHAVSDSLIGVAYASIATTLYALIRKVRLPFTPMFWAFGVFIGFCGGTHLMEVYNLWNSEYWLSAGVKIITAAASVTTAVLLYPLAPKVVAIARSAELAEERRMQLESAHEELKALYERVRSLDEQKTRFFANVSHELRTPLAIITGHTERLRGQRELPPERVSSLDAIYRSARALTKHVNDLLDIAKLEAGETRLRYARLDLAALVQRTVSLFEALARERQISLSVQAPASLALLADPDKVERVLLNLLSNAMRFTPAGGQVRCSVESRGKHVRLEIADSGPGVPPELRESIFARFVQAEPTLTRKHGGTGLGLAIVKDFVQLHRGSVRAEQAPEGGALFSVELPAEPDGVEAVTEAESPPSNEAAALAIEALADLAPQPASRASAEVGAGTVLVVEDNRAMADFLAETLAEYAVSVASDGAEGLAQAEALQPDLIITDLMMPTLSGDQLVSAVRESPLLAHTPVLVLTAKADDDSKVQLLRAGASDHLQKPMLREELLARARNLVRGKRARDVLSSELALRTDDLEGLARELVLRKHELEAALESARAARTQAERAAELKGMFLTLVSHELVTPLQSLLLNLDAVVAKSETFTLPERTRLTRVERASRRLLHLIDSVLAYVQVESGVTALRVEPVDLAALLQGLVDEFRPEAQRKLLELTLTPQDDAPAVVTDPRLVRVALMNLLANALKFTERGYVRVSLARERQGVRISVSDSGPGIPPERLRDVFEPFVIGEPLQRRHVAGMGLGLTVAAKAAEALGGTITARSQLGEGTSVEVSLPLSVALPAARAGIPS